MSEIDDAIDLEEACPDCIDCKAPLSLVEGGEWPEIGPVCYGCLAGRHASLKAEVERLTPREMTIEEGIAVLNRQKHIGYETWHLCRIEGKSMAMIGDGSWWLTEFETKAIAQAYERNAKGGE